ncbi:hypothetical protein IQ236_13845 [Planktothrix mougeotii LEGE 06226]|uniref:AB hydrolase-1 domain-containing protein n=2 Tax=Planktothrix mougeotii TaxID=54306 RepID=A0ABR9UCW0_9CYAN|nr:hypothetical protein [Planktothrix mougeotii LEGE 06226]
MSFDVVFVHGTGVREPAYTRSFNTISDKLKAKDSNLRLHRCYWGESCGTKLNKGGITIPNFDTPRDAIDDNLSDEEEITLGLWKLLYQNPLAELQILSSKIDSQQKELEVDPPWKPSPSEELRQRIRKLHSSSSLYEKLEQAGIAKVFNEACTVVVQNRDYQKVIKSAQSLLDALDEYSLAIARAIVAKSVVLLESEYDDPTLSLNDDLRDEIVLQIAEKLGDNTPWRIHEIPKNVLINSFIGLCFNHLQGNRHTESEKYSKGIGDILMYQARGQKIRDYIRDIITPLPGPVVLIGHSLGGIACVDLLLEKNPPQVHLLITVGSQAPLLYELNALVGMEYSPNATLPPNFPRWLNIYTKNDLLSYVGGKILAGVEDEKVEIKEPFPKSHGAYWTNDEMWDKVLERMRK